MFARGYAFEVLSIQDTVRQLRCWHFVYPSEVHVPRLLFVCRMLKKLVADVQSDEFQNLGKEDQVCDNC